MSRYSKNVSFKYLLRLCPSSSIGRVRIYIFMPDIFERLVSKTTLGPPSVYRVQVTRSHPPFHRAICRRLSSSKDMIILALISDRVTVTRQNGIAISRRCDGYDHAKGNGLVNFIGKTKRAGEESRDDYPDRDFRDEEASTRWQD